MVAGAGLFLSFWACNWEEYHTGVLKTGVGELGLIEGQWVLIIMFLIQGLTNGAFGKATMREVGVSLMPEVDEAKVQANIASVLQQVTNKERLNFVQENVHAFAEIRLVVMLLREDLNRRMELVQAFQRLVPVSIEVNPFYCEIY